MNLFSPILRWFGLGAVSNPDKGDQTGTSGGAGTDAGISVTDERALKVSPVWRCVELITNSVALLPIEFYEKDKSGRKELERHYLTDLFHVRPNRWMKPRDFRKAMTMQMVMWSNAYAEIVWSGSRPVALMPLRPGRMTPFITDDGQLTYHYQIESGVKVYAPKSILHLKGFGTDGIVGLERNTYARQTLGVSVSADVFASKQFANGGRSSGGYLTVDSFLTDPQRAQIKALYEGMTETAYNKGKLWLLEGGVKYDPDTINPDTMQMIETRTMQLGEVARFFGVPEVMIGAGANGASAWPASFEQQVLSFLTFTLQDYLDEWQASIRYSLMTPSDSRKIIVEHDTSNFIKMDSKTRAEVQSKLVQNGLKTRAEIRAFNNDKFIDGSDELTVQTNLSPLDELEGAINNVSQTTNSTSVQQ